MVHFAIHFRMVNIVVVFVTHQSFPFLVNIKSNNDEISMKPERPNRIVTVSELGDCHNQMTVVIMLVQEPAAAAA